MSRAGPPPEREDGSAGDAKPYDRGSLSYAGTFTNPLKARTIRTLEWATGKAQLLRRIRRFEAEGVETGPPFFTHALRVMGITVETSSTQGDQIPATGPCVVVANHPHGLVDGMVLAEIVGRVRQDYRILTRSLLTGVPEVAGQLIPVPFAHEPDSQARNLSMRRQAMDHLARGGCIIMFPAGGVAASESLFGPAVEKGWSPFTAKLIRRSRATVVPICFPGQNSRAYQIANRISATLRQGLLLHEVVHALDKPQSPVVRPAIPPAVWQARAGVASEFMDWLRDKTLNS